MKFTQFVKQFRDENPDLAMTHADCMKNEHIKKAFKELVGSGACIQQKDKNVNVIINIKEKDADAVPQTSGKRITAPGPAVVKGGPTLQPLPGPPPTQQLDAGDFPPSVKGILKPKKTRTADTQTAAASMGTQSTATDPLATESRSTQFAPSTSSMETQFAPSTSSMETQFAPSTASQGTQFAPTFGQMETQTDLTGMSPDMQEYLKQWADERNDILRQRNDLIRISEALIESQKKLQTSNEDLKVDQEFLEQASKDFMRHTKEREDMSRKLEQLEAIREKLEREEKIRDDQLDNVIKVGRQYERTMNYLTSEYAGARERMADLLGRSFTKTAVKLPSIYAHVGDRIVAKDELGRWRYVDEQGNFSVDDEGNPTGFVSDDDRKYIRVAVTRPQISQVEKTAVADPYNPLKRPRTEKSKEGDETFTGPGGTMKFEDISFSPQEGMFGYADIYPAAGEKIPESEGSGVIDCCPAIRGYGLSADNLRNLLEASYSGAETVGDFELDKELATENSKTYYNPTTGQVVVAHKGTQGTTDWGNNLVYALSGEVGYKQTSRYKEAERIQKGAKDKYGKDNITTIGHSQGGLQAQMLGSRENSRETITVNKATRPGEVVYGSSKKRNQYDVRSSRDPVSTFRSPLSGDKKFIEIQSDTYDPLAEHSYDVLNALGTQCIGDSRYCTDEVAGQGIAGPQHGFNDTALAEFEKKWQDKLWQGDFNTQKEWDSEKKKWVNVKAYRSALARMEPQRKKALKELMVRLDKNRDAFAKKYIKSKK